MDVDPFCYVEAVREFEAAEGWSGGSLVQLLRFRDERWGAALLGKAIAVEPVILLRLRTAERIDAVTVVQEFKSSRSSGSSSGSGVRVLDLACRLPSS